MEPAVGPTAFAFDAGTAEEFLHFGYLPRADEADPFHLLAERGSVEEPSLAYRSDREMAEVGAAALRRTFERCAERAPGGGKQIVFLSGGLDSRAILGGLLDNFGTEEIVTATFGRPGEPDFDYARVVSASVGVQHEVLDSSTVTWSTDGLVRSASARRLPFPFPLGQRYLSYILHTRIGPSHTFWDGLAGGAVSGVNLRGDTSSDWDAAVRHFVARSGPRRGGERLVRAGFRSRVRSSFPSAPLRSASEFSYADQLDFAVRQPCYIATRLMTGYRIITPHLVGPWLDFVLGLPMEVRVGRRAYLEILRRCYPRLFALPSTTPGSMDSAAPKGRRNLRRLTAKARSFAGRPRRSTYGSDANATINAAMVHRPELRALVDENLSDLRERGLVDWVDVDAILASRDSDQPHTALLRRLVSLEINLKALGRLGDDPSAGQSGPGGSPDS
jgi:hypothetical protein